MSQWKKMIFENAGVAIRKITPLPSSEIKPGAILSSSWGYDQTNIDFYMIKSIKGKFATVVELKSECTYGSSDMTTKELPTFQEEGQPFRRMIKGNYLKISSFQFASLWDGQPETATHYA